VATTSLQFSVLTTLKTLLDARTPGLDGVQRSLGRPAGDDQATEYVWLLGSSDLDQEHTRLSGGQARVARENEFDIDIKVGARSKVGPEANYVRLGEIVAQVELIVAEDPRLGNLDGVNWCVLTGIDIDLGRKERQPEATADLILTVSGRLR